MLVLQVLTFIILLAIAWQDFKFRAVYWWLFVVLLVALAALKLFQTSLLLMLTDLSYNIAFLGAQFIFLTLYFSIKERRVVNVFRNYFGLGDLFFLLSITVYFSFFNYVMYYLFSLFAIILLNIFIQFFVKKTTLTIPLAGEQALVLIVFMFVDAVVKNIDLTIDLDWGTYI